MIKKFPRVFYLLALLIVYGSFASAQERPTLLLPANNSILQHTKNLQLQWTAENQSTVFRLQYALDPLFKKIQNELYVSGTEVMISDLVQDTFYYWRVSISEFDTLWSEVWKFRTTDFPVVPQPVFPADNAINQKDTINFVWNTNPNNSKFIIQVSKDPKFVTTEINLAVNYNQANVTGLSFNTNYYWRVKAQNIDFDTSAWSSIRKFKTKLTTIVQMSPYNGERNVDTSLSLKCEQVDGAEVYRFQVSLKKSFDDINIIRDITVPDSEATINELNIKSEYYWRVLAYNFQGDSSFWSEPAHFVTKISDPVLISPLDKKNNIDTSVTFLWDAPPSNQRFRFQISDDVTFSKSILDTSFARKTIALQGLSYNTIYYWRIKGFNSEKDSSTWQTFNFKTRLSQPEILYPEDKSASVPVNAKLRWKESAGTESYRVQLSFNNSFDSDSVKIDTLVSETSVILDSLEYATKYYLRVLAFNSAHDSSYWSKIISFKTRMMEPSLIFPYNNEVTVDTASTFRWSKLNYYGYRIQIAEDNNFEAKIIDTISGKNFIKLDSLECNKKYFWRVLGFNANSDTSEWSSVFQFKTALPYPFAITPVDSSVNIPVTVDFKWRAVEGTTYKFRAGEDSLFYYPVIDTTLNRNLFRLFNLQSGTTYYWQVQAFNSSKDSSVWTRAYRFKTNSGMVVSSDSLKKIINLTETLSDTLGFISFENNSNEDFVVDSFFVEPDSILILQNPITNIPIGDEYNIYIRVDTSKIKPGTYSGSLNYFRNEFGSKSKLRVPFNFILKKATGEINVDSLEFNRTSSKDSLMKQFTIKNVDANVNLIIKKIRFTGDSLSYKISRSPKNIMPGDSSTISVLFKPAKAGLNISQLVMETNSYPERNIIVDLKGTGTGGELTKESYQSFSDAVKDSFETFTLNKKILYFNNSGNEDLNISITFWKKYFKTVNDFHNNFKLKPGDTISVAVKYLTPNFRKANIDSMFIIHNGFGVDTFAASVKGIFDSTESSQKLVSNTRINSEPFDSFIKVVGKNSGVVFNVNPALLSDMPNTEFRLKYYTGGNGTLQYSYNDGNYNFIISGNKVDERGLMIWGELIKKNTTGKIVDSIIVFNKIDLQVLLDNYKTISVNSPRSTPSENVESAKTKWVIFGFPQADVIADSVFKYFGGIKNMKDAEWIIYNYNAASTEPFNIFNNYFFEPGKSYFFAQSLLDTFKINYIYSKNLRTKKLTDNEISISGSGWKTITSPYLFDVEVDTSIMLYRYDVDYMSYRLTNIMEPGVGYFVEPAIQKLKLKTYGKFNPLNYPKSFSKSDWFMKLTCSNGSIQDELYFSINPALQKNNKEDISEQQIPPQIQNDLSIYIRGSENKKLKYSLANSEAGAEWDIVLHSEYDCSITITPDIIGKLNDGYSYRIYDINKQGIITNNKVYVEEKSDYRLKLIIGTPDFINAAINRLKSTPEKFALYQNYPNPFNASTIISYQLPVRNHITLKVFDILGREVYTVVDKELDAGIYKTSFQAENLSSGIYFLRISTDKFSETRKMILLK